MKIAVSSQNRREITEHLGKCRNFRIYVSSDDGSGAKCTGTLALAREQMLHEHPRDAAHPLDEMQVLITGGMGEGMCQRLAQKNIRGVVTRETDPDKAVAAFLAGTLMEAAPGCGCAAHGAHEVKGPTWSGVV